MQVSFFSAKVVKWQLCNCTSYLRNYIT